jgi:hypothetical protein
MVVFDFYLLPMTSNYCRLWLLPIVAFGIDLLLPVASTYCCLWLLPIVACPPTCRCLHKTSRDKTNKVKREGTSKPSKRRQYKRSKHIQDKQSKRARQGTNAHKRKALNIANFKRFEFEILCFEIIKMCELRHFDLVLLCEVMGVT